jgi:S1-C subfamily serine protease
MTFELFSRVALKEDIPRHGLRRGDVATVVEHHPVSQEEDGYSLEVFNAIGETLAVIVVAESQIESLMNNEVLHIRRLDEAV